MKFTLSEKDLLKSTNDTAALFVHEGEQVKGIMSSAINDFNGKDGQLCVVYPETKDLPKRVLLIGLGAKEKFHLNKIRIATALAVNFSRNLEIKSLAFSAVKDLLLEEECVAAVVESVIMANHKFDMFKSDRVNPQLAEIIIAVKKKGLQKHVDYSVAVAEHCVSARDLINMPASIATPEYIADKTKELPKSVKVTIYNKKALEKMNANGILAVSAGSVNEPRLVVLEYSPAKAKKSVALVGKGITFDSGGLSIKPASAMETMKTDMAGAVAVLHTVAAAAEMNVNVKIIGIMALTENIIGPLSYKPGDIIKTMSGKTIEILNTDAEGRVVLADALHVASSFNADYMIDIATLTGACVVALGQEASGLMGTDLELIEMLKKSGNATYERVWELPLFDEYADLILSDFADMKNVVSNSPSPTGAGAITAAKFLQNYAKGKWAHIDIAGTDWVESDRGYKPKGATGVGVRLLTHFLSNL